MTPAEGMAPLDPPLHITHDQSTNQFTDLCYYDSLLTNQHMITAYVCIYIALTANRYT